MCRARCGTVLHCWLTPALVTQATATGLLQKPAAWSEQWSGLHLRLFSRATAQQQYSVYQLRQDVLGLGPGCSCFWHALR